MTDSPKPTPTGRVIEGNVNVVSQKAAFGAPRPSPGPLVEDTTVSGGLTEAGAPVIAPKSPDGKAPGNVRPTDPSEGR